MERELSELHALLEHQAGEHGEAMSMMKSTIEKLERQNSDLQNQLEEEKRFLKIILYKQSVPFCAYFYGFQIYVLGFKLSTQNDYSVCK